jgi:hypothetical protein
MHYVAACACRDSVGIVRHARHATVAASGTTLLYNRHCTVIMYHVYEMLAFLLLLFLLVTHYCIKSIVQ